MKEMWWETTETQLHDWLNIVINIGKKMSSNGYIALPHALHFPPHWAKV